MIRDIYVSRREMIVLYKHIQELKYRMNHKETDLF